MSTLSKKEWRIGLAGAGWVSQHHLTAWKSLPNARVVAICDPRIERARERARAFDIAACYPDAAAMLAGSPIDALDIAAPREWHAPLVRLAAAGGLPVLCQKPLAPTLGEAEALVGEVAGKTRLMPHENWRFRPFYRQAAQWIRAGEIGAVRQAVLEMFASALLHPPGAKAPLLERQPFLAGLEQFFVSESLIHHLDALRFLCGPLEVVGACLNRISPEVRGEDTATILMRSSAGAGVMLAASFSAHGAPIALADRLRILGDTGSITLEGNTLRLSGARAETREYDLAECYQASYTGAIRHFIDCLESGAEFETADNLETLRLVDQIYKVAG